MITAVLTSVAVWCVLPSSTRRRQRDLFVVQGLSRRPAPALLGSVAAPVAALALIGWPAGAVVGIALVPIVHAAIGRLESAASRQRRARIEAQLPAALDLMVSALDVGRPPVVAVGLAADATAEPLGAELGQLASRLAVAIDAIAVWNAMLDDPALAPVGRAFRRAETSGMPVARVIAGVADELRRDRRARRRDDSRKVAVRTAAPLGACFLPAFFLIGIVPTIMGAFRGLSF